MERNEVRGIVALCRSVALLAGVAAAAGVFLRGDGAATLATSVRGETYPMVASGVYAYNAQRIVAEGVGWDWVTLLLAAPALLVALPALARGSLRGRLFAIGMLGYFFYQYLMYATFWAFGPLFPLFVALFSASLFGIAWIASTIPLAELPERFTERFPRKAMAVLCWVLAAALLAMWSARIAAGLRGDWAGAMLLGSTTMVVQALDLGLVVPLAVLTGALAWRGRPLGYLLCAAFVVKAVTMSLAICAMLLSARAVEGRLEIPPLAMFGAAAAVSAWLGVRMYTSVRR
jgi:hypothetical protein